MNLYATPVWFHPSQIQQVERFLSIAEKLKSAGPQSGGVDGVLLMGDFNAPSHLDWRQRQDVEFPPRTKAMAEQFFHQVIDVEWPTTKTLEEGLAGGSLKMVDTFRLKWPDARTHPGYVG